MLRKRILNADAIFGTVILAICIWFFMMGRELASVGLKGSINAGFFPRILALLVGALAVGLIVRSFFSPQAYFSTNNVDKKNIRNLLGTIMIFGLYIALWKIVHFIPLTLVFLLTMCWLLRLSWKFAVIYAAVISCGLFYLFASVFKIILN